MLTVAEERVKDLTKKYGRELVTQPYGGEIKFGKPALSACPKCS
jgi:hypothetical protein